MSFEAKQYEIRELLKDGLFRIPRNQREYVWGKNNWNELFNDLIFAYENKNSHFIGSVVLMKCEKNHGLQEYKIIDGQQRIMTLSILLSVILYKFRELGCENDYKGSEKYIVTSNDINERVNVLNRNITNHIMI